MNLLEATVTKVTGEPMNKFNKWFIEVEYTCYGQESTTTLMLNTKEECLAVTAGYTFLA